MPISKSDATPTPSASTPCEPTFLAARTPMTPQARAGWTDYLAQHRLNALVATMAMALAACGGGSDTATRNATSQDLGLGSAEVLQVATFVDAPVAGLEYEGTGYSGLTDDQGRFHYRAGDRVTFRLGKVVLGSTVPANATVTPLDLAADAADATDDRVVRMLRTLQSLDDDGDPENGIRIDTTTRQQLQQGEAIDLSHSETSDGMIEARLPGRTFRQTRDDAVAHFERWRQVVDKQGTPTPTHPTTPPTTVSQPASSAGRLLASNCFQCHGTGGMGGFERIRGGEAAEVFEYLTKPASSDIMAAHAQGYTRAQLQAIVDYLRR